MKLCFLLLATSRKTSIKIHRFLQPTLGGSALLWKSASVPKNFISKLKPKRLSIIFQVGFEGTVVTSFGLLHVSLSLVRTREDQTSTESKQAHHTEKSFVCHSRARTWLFLISKCVPWVSSGSCCGKVSQVRCVAWFNALSSVSFYLVKAAILTGNLPPTIQGHAMQSKSECRPLKGETRFYSIICICSHW